MQHHELPWWYPLLDLLIYVKAGAIFYILDRKYAAKWYTKWYNFSHKTPIEAGKQLGFIFNQRNRKRFGYAIFIAGTQSIIWTKGFDHDPLIEFISWFIEVPCMMLGFIIGPVIYRIWEKKDKLFHHMDRVESGQVDIAGDLSRKASENLNQAKGNALRFSDRLMNWIESFFKKKKPVPAPAPNPVSVAPQTPPTVMTEEEARAAMRKIGGNR